MIIKLWKIKINVIKMTKSERKYYFYEPKYNLNRLDSVSGTSKRWGIVFKSIRNYKI